MKKITYDEYTIEILKIKKKDKVIIYDKKSTLSNKRAIKIMEYLFLEGFINDSVVVCEIVIG